MALADAEGLDAVTMRRMAAELGLGTMSLYNYVPTKDHLVQLMIDQVGGEYRFPARRPADIRQAIVDLARQGRDITQRHPWLPGVIAARPPVMGPAALRYVDYFLGLLSGTGLDTAAKMELLGLVNGFAISYGGMQAALAEDAQPHRRHRRAAGRRAGQPAGSGRGQWPLPEPGRRARRSRPRRPRGRGRGLRLLRPPPDRRVPARQRVRMREWRTD